MNDQANDLNEVELDGIEAIDAEINALQAKKQQMLEAKRTDALQKVLKLVSAFGFTAQELGLVAPAKASSTPSKTKLPAKYRNPNNPAETWHGSKGPKPKWVRAFLDNGGVLDNILIQK